MTDVITLNNGNTITEIGFGTWQISDGEEVTQAVVSAVAAGYRLIDTAKIYGNEVGVGNGIKSSGVPREDLFITSKLWNDDQGYESALLAFDQTLERLELEYLDLYLMHWPISGKRLDSWKALEEIYKSGKAKNIGVSNFTIRHLEELLAVSNIAPAVNQVEFHPFLFDEQKALLEYCNAKGITLEAYSPLAHGQKLENETITKIAKKHTKTNAQILLRWAVEHGVVPIPKSRSAERMAENIAIFDFKLDDEDMEKLNAPGDGTRTCPDPNEME